MFIKDNRRFDPFRPHTIDGVRYPHLRDPALRQQLGITEIPDPTPPEDFSDDIYYVTQQDTEPYTIWTRKSDEQIQQAKNGKLLSQIDSLERSTMLPRVAREFMMASFIAALPEGTDPMTNIGFKKMKELDDEIKALRQQIVTVPV